MKLKKEYPEMRLIHQEVISTFNKVYREGVKNGFCPLIGSSSLSMLFVDGSLAYYENFKKTHRERARVRAENIRKAK